ncbi:hypothetical protein KSP39_PZI010888 [Platanthera zijinensis]|uniref:Uncharacterized protein n=1 Tax=Platanthera zijinensis TaxID=2320716 RepID=A0AAP0BG99_9ASPA
MAVYGRRHPSSATIQNRAPITRHSFKIKENMTKRRAEQSLTSALPRKSTTTDHYRGRRHRATPLPLDASFSPPYDGAELISPPSPQPDALILHFSALILHFAVANPLLSLAAAIPIILAHAVFRSPDDPSAAGAVENGKLSGELTPLSEKKNSDLESGSARGDPIDHTRVSLIGIDSSSSGLTKTLKNPEPEMRAQRSEVELVAKNIIGGCPRRWEAGSGRKGVDPAIYGWIRARRGRIRYVGVDSGCRSGGE